MGDVIVCSSIENLNPLLHKMHPEWTMPLGGYGTLDRPADIRRTTISKAAGILHASSNGITPAVRELKPGELVSGIGYNVACRPSRIGPMEAARPRLYKEWAGGCERVSGVGIRTSTLQERATIEAAVPVPKDTGIGFVR